MSKSGDLLALGQSNPTRGNIPNTPYDKQQSILGCGDPMEVDMAKRRTIHSILG